MRLGKNWTEKPHSQKASQISPWTQVYESTVETPPLTLDTQPLVTGEIPWTIVTVISIIPAKIDSAQILVLFTLVSFVFLENSNSETAGWCILSLYAVSDGRKPGEGAEIFSHPALSNENHGIVVMNINLYSYIWLYTDI